jgi:tyrosinase
MADPVRTRRSLRELQTLYDSGDKQPLEDVVRAFRGIQDMESSAMFELATFHGAPEELRAGVPRAK